MAVHLATRSNLTRDDRLRQILLQTVIDPPDHFAPNLGFVPFDYRSHPGSKYSFNAD